MKKQIELRQLRPGDVIVLSRPINVGVVEDVSWRVKSNLLLDEEHTIALVIGMKESTTRCMYKVYLLLKDSFLQKSLTSHTDIMLIQ